MFNPEGDFIRKINFGPKSAVERSSLDFHPVPHVLLASPYSFTIDSDGKIVLVDYSYHRIVVYHAIDKHAPKEMDAQVFLTCGGQQEKGTPLPPEAKLQNPIAIVMDQGIVYLSDYGNHRICVFGSVDK